MALDPSVKTAMDELRDSIKELDLADEEYVALDRALMDWDPAMLHAISGVIRKARAQGPAWQPPGT